MNEQERLTRIATALRKAYELIEEGSEAHGYIAEALAYADGDVSSFDDEHNLEDEVQSYDCACC